MKHRCILIIIASITIVATGVTIVLTRGFSDLANTPDGTQGLTGVKVEAAKWALEFDKSEYSPAVFSDVAMPHVEAISKTVPKQGDYATRRCSDNPNDLGYYSVTIRRVFLFGTTYAKTTYNMCNLGI